MKIGDKVFANMHEKAAGEEISIKNLLDNVPGGIIVYEWTGTALKTIHISKKYADLYGSSLVSERGNAGGPDFERVHPDDREVFRAAVIEAAMHANNFTYTYRVWNDKEDKYVWTKVNASAIEENGKRYIYAAYTDVTQEVMLRQAALEAEQRKMAKEEQLRLQIERLNNKLVDVMDYVPGGVCLFRWTGKQMVPIIISKNFSDLMGRDVEVMLAQTSGMDYADIHPEDLEGFKKFALKGLQTENVEISHRYRHFNQKQGKYIWIEIRVKVRPQTDGTKLVYASYMDVSASVENEKNQEARMNMERRYLHNRDDSLVMHYEFNLTKNTVLVDKGIYEEVIGNRQLSIDKLVELSLPYIQYEKDREVFIREHSVDNLKAAYAKGELGKTYEIHVKDQHGENFMARFVWHMLREPKTGNVIIYEYIYNISAERLMQDFLKIVLSKGYDQVGLLDVKYNLYYVLEIDPKTDKPAVRQEHFGTMVDRVAHTAAENESQFRANCDSRTMLERAERGEAFVQKLIVDGEIRYKKYRCHIIDKEKGLVLLTKIDVTHLMLLEEQEKKKLEDALDKAEQATKAKTEFLSRMSHELRTPMNAIIGLNALTYDETDDAKAVKENLDKMRSASDFMLGLINDILDMAKIEDGKVELKLEPYSYHEFLVNLKTIFAAQCKAKDIELTFKEPKINPVILVDKVRMNQIFFNIMSNAVKYTPVGGRIDYYVENLEMDKQHLSVDYVIQDNGIGMSKEFQKKMFDPFSQEDTTYTAELKGTGLGMSITKQLVEKMGGKLSVESEQGKGTKVVVHLAFPLIEKDVKVVEKKQQDIAHGELAGKTVLLVEDHPMNAMIAKKLLEKHQVNVIRAENGKAAVDAVRNSDPGDLDAILMDIRMPVMDGYQATRAIRELNRTDAKVIPIIAMSANAYVDDIQKSLDVGMNAHLAKPIDPQKMYQTIAWHIQAAGNKNKRRKILIVDDLDVSRAVVESTIADRYEVLNAQEGKEALAVLEKNPEIIGIITDLQMPIMDGEELIKAIRAERKYDGIAILVNTLYGDLATEQRLLLEGADDFIYKPLAPKLLSIRLNNVLAGKQQTIN